MIKFPAVSKGRNAILQTSPSRETPGRAGLSEEEVLSFYTRDTPQRGYTWDFKFYRREYELKLFLMYGQQN